jgi:hypothetical protein
MGHTKLNWKTSGTPAHVGEEFHLNIFGSDGYACARAYGENAGECRANAAYIVKACNNHDELVAALTEAKVFIENGVALGFIRMPDKDVPDPAHNTLPMIKAILAKVEG